MFCYRSKKQYFEITKTFLTTKKPALEHNLTQQWAMLCGSLCVKQKKKQSDIVFCLMQSSPNWGWGGLGVA